MQRRVGREPVQNAVRPRVAFRPKPSVLLGAAPRSTSRRFLRALQRSGASGVPWPPTVPTSVDPPGGGRHLRRDSCRTLAAPPRPKAPSPLRALAPPSRALTFRRAARHQAFTPCGGRCIAHPVASLCRFATQPSREFRQLSTSLDNLWTLLWRPCGRYVGDGRHIVDSASVGPTSGRTGERR